MSVEVTANVCNLMRNLTFCISIIVFLSLACAKADDKPATPPAKDPQATYEPRSSPGEGQKFLTQFVGNWSVVKTFHPRNGQPVVSRGTCTQTMIHDGRFLRSDFVFNDGAGQTTGMGIIGFDADSGKFTSFWTDSRSTRFSIRQSRDKFDGSKIVLLSKSLDDPNARQSRTITHLEDNGKRITHQQFAASPDGSERLMMELVMQKQ
jgi:hypothetical protein